MTPQALARGRAQGRQLLVLDPHSGQMRATALEALPSLLRPGDVAILNDAATLPAALHTVSGALEVRLASREEDGSFWALAFGAGTSAQRTEERPAPPLLHEGAVLTFAAGLRAQVCALSGRRVRLRFESDEDALWPALYRAGRPVQYAYLRDRLALWDVQTAYAGRPWAFEAPSAGLGLPWRVLLRLRERGVRVGHLTHAAGLSSTGDEALDATMPWTERYDLPEETLTLIEAAKANGGRIFAVGTTVVRALEGCVHDRDRLFAGEGRTALRIGPSFVPRIVDGVLSGVHAPGESHFELLEAFAPRRALEAAFQTADAAGFTSHEFGDAMAILPQAPRC